MINKPTVIITSLGRTGTTFFEVFLNRYFDFVKAFHEPDKIRLRKFSPRQSLDAVKRLGIKRTIINKLSGNSLLSASNRAISGQISKEVAAREIIRSRKKFIEKTNAKIYIESNYQFYGLLEALPLAFKSYRGIYIIRDPRDWVRSWINKGGMYDKRDINKILGNRLSPAMFASSEISEKKWKRISTFEKLCWLWGAANKNILGSQFGKNIRLERYEDLFGADGCSRLLDLLNFMFSFPGANVRRAAELKAEIKNFLKNKINRPDRYSFPHWHKWDKKQAAILNKHCGQTMKKIGYGLEKEWAQMLQE